MRDLIRRGRLSDALSDTQNPNSEADSPQNKRSAAIREAAAASAARLAGDPQVPAEQEMNALFLLCKDSDAAVKTAAEGGLKKIGEQDDPGLRAIVGRLNDGDPDIRAGAVSALGLIGADTGFGDKAARLVDGVLLDPASQDSAESALQQIGAPAVPYVRAHLDGAQGTVEFRQAMVSLLGQIGTAGVLQPLLRVAEDGGEHLSVRREATEALASIVLSSDAAARKAAQDSHGKPVDIQKAAAAFAQARQAAPVLLAALGNTDAGGPTRAQAALALGRLGGPAATAALIRALGDYDIRVRQAAEAGVQSVGPAAAAPLAAALARGDVPSRALAAEALGGIGDPPAIAALNAAFGDPATPDAVRQSAAVGLGRSGSPGVIPVLVRALGDRSGGVQSAASDALLSPALSARAVPLLIAAFVGPTPAPFNASQTLARLGNQAVPPLEQAARSADARTQTWAAVTLGLTDSEAPDIVPALTPLAASADPQVRFAAQEAINRLSGA